MMIHDPWTVAIGGAGWLRKQAASLDLVKNGCIDIYADRSGASREDLGVWMTEETWWGAEEAVAAGMATGVSTNMAVAACKDRKLFKFAHTPPELLEDRADTPIGPEDWSQANKMRQKRVAEIHAQYRHEPS